MNIMKRNKLSLACVIIAISFLCCDPPEQWEPDDRYTALLVNNTQDSLVFVFEDRNGESLLYYHDSIDNVDERTYQTDKTIPFFFETDNNGNYLHWEIMPPYSKKHSLAGILNLVSIAGLKYNYSNDTINRITPQLQIGVIKYSDFEECWHNREKLDFIGVIEHYNLVLLRQVQRKDWIIGYYGQGNMVAYQ